MKEKRPQICFKSMSAAFCDYFFASIFMKVSNTKQTKLIKRIVPPTIKKMSGNAPSIPNGLTYLNHIPAVRPIDPTMAVQT